MTTLKPCPFCGGIGTLWSIDQCDTAYAVCQDCGARTVDYKHAEEAIAAWNSRVDARQLALKTRVCPMCEDCPDGCPVETPKDSRNIVTNADRIRSMNDEELAYWISNLARECEENTECKQHCYGCDEMYCETNLCLKWLWQQVKEEV